MSAPPCTTLVALLQHRAQQQPHAVAYVFLLDGERQTEQITYLQLHQQAQRLAARLQALDPPAQAAGLLYPPGLRFIEALFGCFYAGLVAIPLQAPPGLKRLQSVAAILRDAGTTLVLTSAEWLETLPRGSSSGVDSGAGHEPLRWLATDAVEEQHQHRWQPPACQAEAAAFYQYTSGTTQAPRGVVVSHANVLANEALIQQAFQHDPATLGLGWLPHFHDMGLVGNILQMLYLGRPCILMSPFHFIQRPFRWLQAISEHRATSSGGPNFAYELCVRKISKAQRDQLDLSRWTLAFSGAETVRAGTIQRFTETFAPCGFDPRAFYPCYGLAEATLFVTGGKARSPLVVCHVSRQALRHNRVVPVAPPTAAPAEQPALALVGCGHAGEGHELLIVDPVQRTRCPADRVGEIWLRGASVALGYRNRREETEHTFMATLADSGEGPFLRTGDLGFLQDQQLFLTGRRKDVIILQGTTLYPQDIELTVERCWPGLAPGAGAAFSVEGEGGEQVVVVQEVERTALRSIQLGACIETIRRQVLALHGVRLAAVVLIKPATLPRTTSGKVRRASCREAFLAGGLAVVQAWARH